MTTATVVRRGVTTADRGAIDRLLAASRFFNAEELQVAIELVDDRLALGDASHYRFLVAEANGEAVGYACWGPIPGTDQSVDLYWIAVDPDAQGRGIGRALLEAAERWIVESGRSRVYVETASRAQYAPTRAFYRACGYHVVAELVEFYSPGDGKVIFLKVLG